MFYAKTSNEIEIFLIYLLFNPIIKIVRRFLESYFRIFRQGVIILIPNPFTVLVFKRRYTFRTILSDKKNTNHSCCKDRHYENNWKSPFSSDFCDSLVSLLPNYISWNRCCVCLNSFMSFWYSLLRVIYHLNE